jgi:hypothetical protein
VHLDLYSVYRHPKKAKASHGEDVCFYSEQTSEAICSTFFWRRSDPRPVDTAEEEAEGVQGGKIRTAIGDRERPRRGRFEHRDVLCMRK